MPQEFQGDVVGELNKRKGMITTTETANELTVVEAEVPLACMFGYANDLRSMTQVPRARVSLSRPSGFLFTSSHAPP